MELKLNKADVFRDVTDNAETLEQLLFDFSCSSYCVKDLHPNAFLKINGNAVCLCFEPENFIKTEDAHADEDLLYELISIRKNVAGRIAYMINKITELLRQLFKYN